MDTAVDAFFSSSSSDSPSASAGAKDYDDRPFNDGSGRYSLMAIISHMGKNTECGHYVCHVKKGGRWFLFNDEKVSEWVSE